ncbi:hypothetical protein [Arthrobacter sp. 18067]|uniref:hypothetical protein n=1 Tax=Arthrobacter sp. 18067 TaxID=2681413 RepID=UPI00135BDCE4|nr:hypothetical protein [Arthrobacter sp. 18067]
MVTKISEESLLDMLDAAGYGISYWAVEAVIDEEARTYTVTPEEHPTEDRAPEPIVIPFDSIIGAFWTISDPDAEVKHLSRLTQSYVNQAVVDGEDGDIDAGHIDAHAADQIIQVAAFGEVVFG